MASPQTENGFTRIANELLEAICKLNLSSTQWQVLMLIIRETYGYQRKECEFGLSKIAEVTGADRGNISKALKALIYRNILTEYRKNESKSARILGLNKDFDSWQTVTTNKTDSCQIATVVRSQQLSDRNPDSCQIATPSIMYKEIRKENVISNPAEEFWNLYPQKKDRLSFDRAWMFGDCDEKAEMILQALRNQIKERELMEKYKLNLPYLPNPANWISKKRWLDSVQTETEIKAQSKAPKELPTPKYKDARI